MLIKPSLHLLCAVQVYGSGSPGLGSIGRVTLSSEWSDIQWISIGIIDWVVTYLVDSATHPLKMTSPISDSPQPLTESLGQARSLHICSLLVMSVFFVGQEFIRGRKFRGIKRNLSIDAYLLSYLMLILHVFQLVFQLRECWSYIRVILPAFQHYLIPTIEILLFVFMNIDI